MIKELKALKIGIPKLKKLYENNANKMSKNDILGFDLTFVYLDKALQRLEAIDNAKPSEAINSLNKLWDTFICSTRTNEKYVFENPLVRRHIEDYENIKQALLKAQKQEKVLEIIFKYRINVGLFHTLVNLCRNSYKTCKEENKFVGSNIADNEFPTEEEFNLLKEVLCDD